ncbi:hypothetical protein BDZ89DRAFT_797746 [Hymenopellis radicata]|nr:hypothetical protein BDZ89DRAFT_797746 [Hymenopellis radicata]
MEPPSASKMTASSCLKARHLNNRTTEHQPIRPKHCQSGRAQRFANRGRYFEQTNVIDPNQGEGGRPSCDTCGRYNRGGDIHV